MPPARSAAAAMLLSAAAGCGLGAEQPIAVLQIAPAAGYYESALAATISGQGFRPAYRFDTVSGSARIDVGGFSATLVSSADAAAPARYPLTKVVWESVDLLGVEIPPEIPAGPYDLWVEDPGGRTARRTAAFTSLGADVTPPTVTVNGAPSSFVAGGAVISLLVIADDGYGRLAGLQLTVRSTTMLQSYDCPLTGGATAACPFSFTVPKPASATDAVMIDAAATGDGGLIQHADLRLQLVPASTVTAIAPSVGSTQGGTTATLTGSNFLPTTAITFDGLPALVTAVTSTSITVTVPPHPPGSATVAVTTGGATTTLSPFSYLAPPVAREVSPTTAPESGLVAITIVGDGFTTSTVITFDGSPLRCFRLVTSNRIEGFVPPGSGTETILASDPIGGTQTTAGVSFRYLPVPDGGTPSGAVPDASVLPPDGACPASAAP